ncbi:uncharacterized protein LOC101855589 [Aplysia californica]|uniref:Uncharacterized protein LOC101855589 n=1 Tax=Aplysia californica TaxID=6500 RepID=A0ABM0K255_APLCA|nr:uncharacterized protein LOC101855589 [Aplysia californica]XP_005106968.1 uncharacterized protein LOC101855589 [Aplysia californica]
MPFHREWAWYNIYYPNPDAAICRLETEDAEWNRLTRWRDFDWYQCGANEVRKIHTNRGSVRASDKATTKRPELLPPAGMPSETHARVHPGFHFELYYRLLQERETLVRCGQLPQELPGPYPTHALPYGPRQSTSDCSVRGHRRNY